MPSSRAFPIHETSELRAATAWQLIAVAKARMPAGFGIGLSNTRERLTHFYQDNFELRAGRPESGGFEVLITIPYERKDQ